MRAGWKAAWGAVLVAAGVCLWWEVEPAWFPPLKVVQPAAAVAPVLARGDALMVPRAWCAAREMHGIGSPELDGPGGRTWYLPPRAAINRAGCHEVTVVLDMPDGLPAGDYAYRYRSRMSANPMAFQYVDWPVVRFRLE